MDGVGKFHDVLPASAWKFNLELSIGCAWRFRENACDLNDSLFVLYKFGFSRLCSVIPFVIMTLTSSLTVGVLALQGAFSEHLQLLRKAAELLKSARGDITWEFTEVRTSAELDDCDALIVPGGESTTISLIAARSDLLDKLRDFVKYVHFYHHFAAHTLTNV